jgi:hypothetical protein
MEARIIYRREFFDPKLYSQGQDYKGENIAKNQLYKFIYDQKYLCYRIQHPSTIRGKVAALSARKKLISLLPYIYILVIRAFQLSEIPSSNLITNNLTLSTKVRQSPQK